MLSFVTKKNLSLNETRMARSAQNDKFSPELQSKSLIGT